MDEFRLHQNIDLTKSESPNVKTPIALQTFRLQIKKHAHDVAQFDIVLM